MPDDPRVELARTAADLAARFGYLFDSAPRQIPPAVAAAFDEAERVRREGPQLTFDVGAS